MGTTAEFNRTSERERDFPYPVPVEDDTESGRQLAEVQLNDRENKSVGRDNDMEDHSSKTRSDANSSELGEGETFLLNGLLLFLGMSEDSNTYDDELGGQGSSPTNHYFEKKFKSGFGGSSQFIGLGPSTKPKGTRIHYGTYSQKSPKPKFIDDHKTVAVYETVKKNNS